MRVLGLEKFNDPCYIAAINLFLNKNNLDNDKALGAVILYIEESIASDLLLASGKRGVDLEDPEVLMDGTGEFCVEIVDQFKKLVADVYIIGDCQKAGTVKEAVHDGFNVAVEI